MSERPGLSPQDAKSGVSMVPSIYLIVALFIAIIVCLVVLVHIEMNALTAIRAYVGGEGLWAKAQKDAVLSLERYAESHDDADFQTYRRMTLVTLGDRTARLELQKPNPDAAVVRDGFVQGRNSPDDVDNAITFFRRFQHTSRIQKVLAHWTEGDRLMSEIDRLAEELHEEITSGHPSPQKLAAINERLVEVNRKATEEEDQFSATLSDAARWANSVAGTLTSAIALLFVVLGIALSWPIVLRIRATEEALSESEQKFRTITTSAMDAIAMVDDRGRTVLVNAAAERMFGYTAAEMLGQDMHLQLSPPRYLDDYRRAYPHFAKTGEGAEIGKLLELAALRKDGSEFPIELTVSAIRIKGRWNAVGIIRDITERKQAEQKLRELNETLNVRVQERTQQLLAAQEELVRKEKLAVLGRVADTVGHELRNPLGVMNNAVYFLQTVLADADETTREYLGILKEEILDAERIVSDLLDAVRTKPPMQEMVEIGDLIRLVLQKCGVPQSVAVTVDVPEELLPVRVDPHQMHQVFWNLVTNAVEAMPEGGVLHIKGSANVAARTVTVIFTDSGSGITPENQSKLFQPMFTTKPRRVGLGLVVVKNLTEANGGTVRVESMPGRGTTCYVTLPAW